MNMNLLVSIVIIVAGLYFLVKHTLGFIYFCIAGIFIYLLKGFLFTSTTTIIASIVGLIFFAVYLWIFFKIKKDENPKKVDETFSVVYGLTKENISNFITESLKILNYHYLITNLEVDRRSLENIQNINRINIICYKDNREVNIINLIFEDEKAFVRSVNKIIDISKLLYCLRFNNNSFSADLSKSQQIYSNTLL